MELLAIFVGLPILLAWLRRHTHIPVIPVLVVTTIGLLAFTVAMHGPGLLRLLRWSWNRREARRMFALFGVGTVCVFAFTALVYPELFVALPRNHPGRWLLLLATYPVVSVVPQEVLFRVLFFSRYQAVLAGKAGMVAGSSLTFGLAHVVFANWPAVLLSTLGGVLFALRYARTRSLWMVVCEHTLYGWLIFSSGLGPFFYDGGLGPIH